VKWEVDASRIQEQISIMKWFLPFLLLLLLNPILTIPKVLLNPILTIPKDKFPIPTTKRKQLSLTKKIYMNI
jgi:hypothetical protein